MGNKAYHYILSASLLLLGACGEQLSSGAGPDNNPSELPAPIGTITSVRQCTDNEIDDSTTNLLAGFFTAFVSGLEGAPTFCHNFAGTGEGADASLMVEYEDRYGIRSVTFDNSDVIFSRIIPDGSNTLAEAIFRDGYGLVKIHGYGPTSTGILSGQIRYYNFPSFEEALNAEIERLQQECQDGTKTVYECLGYTYPTHWWNQPIHTSEGQQMIEMAREYMVTNSGHYRVLGDIEFDIGVPTWPNLD